ncbi:metal binding-like protein [Glossina pallidipes salivary gland hypertrophy virus]|uniref:Metal binding-like protein n=1 Tax=Glossina hytrovirus (isolate Glossina pallidipes/Ethiopia/Seibersdorf/-) TaxID=379529 RepID=A0A0Y0G7G8_GHVS|nr:metal binding-like protein [Glossina pallidipes salivary gland hypertrophy virus]
MAFPIKLYRILDTINVSDNIEKGSECLLLYCSGVCDILNIKEYNVKVHKISGDLNNRYINNKSIIEIIKKLRCGLTDDTIINIFEFEPKNPNTFRNKIPIIKNLLGAVETPIEFIKYVKKEVEKLPGSEVTIHKETTEKTYRPLVVEKYNNDTSSNLLSTKDPINPDIVLIDDQFKKIVDYLSKNNMRTLTGQVLNFKGRDDRTIIQMINSFKSTFPQCILYHYNKDDPNDKYLHSCEMISCNSRLSTCPEIIKNLFTENMKQNLCDPDTVITLNGICSVCPDDLIYVQAAIAGRNKLNNELPIDNIHFVCNSNYANYEIISNIFGNDMSTLISLSDDDAVTKQKKKFNLILIIIAVVIVVIAIVYFIIPKNKGENLNVYK